MTAHPTSRVSPDDIDYKDGVQEIDTVTGYDTTGHLWNGIRELNTPFPRIVLFFLVATFLYSVIAWVLLPTWPLGRSYTRGLLGLSQENEAVQGFLALEKARQPWMSRFAKADFAALDADKALLAETMPAARRLFEDNCAACHGQRGGGGPGFPDLADRSWLWGGTPAAIARTITVGVNSDDENAQVSQMPSFEALPLSDREKLADFVVALPQGKANATMPGATLFTDNCAPCHGPDGKGGLDNGAPSLADRAVIYGQDHASVMSTLAHGRQGVMPAWSKRLSVSEINLLALYVSRLANEPTERKR
jgi:cytochrome c oxidase cbb3-type subunit 3